MENNLKMLELLLIKHPISLRYKFINIPIKSNVLIKNKHSEII